MADFDSITPGEGAIVQADVIDDAPLAEGEEDISKEPVPQDTEVIDLSSRPSRRFLIGVDLLSDAVTESYGAFDYVACTVRPQDEVYIVSSYGAPVEGSYNLSIVERRAKVLKRLQRLKRHAKQNTQCKNVTAIMSSHDPAGEMIVNQAEQYKPDFVVVGCRDKTAASRVFFGSVSQYVVHHTKFAVIIVNQPPLNAVNDKGKKKTTVNYRVPGRIMTLFDGSDHASEALKVAAEKLVVNDEAGLDVLMIKKKPKKNAEKYTQLGDDDCEEAELAGAVTACAAIRGGVAANTMVRYGDARETATEAVEGQVTTLVMGARGRGSLKRMVLGSVSDYVMRHVNVPAIVVIKQKK